MWYDMKNWIMSFIIAVIVMLVVGALFIFFVCHPVIFGTVVVIIMLLGTAEIIHDQFFD